MNWVDMYDVFVEKSVTHFYLKGHGRDPKGTRKVFLRRELLSQMKTGGDMVEACLLLIRLKVRVVRLPSLHHLGEVGEPLLSPLQDVLLEGRVRVAAQLDVEGRPEELAEDGPQGGEEVEGCGVVLLCGRGAVPLDEGGHVLLVEELSLALPLLLALPVPSLTEGFERSAVHVNQPLAQEVLGTTVRAEEGIFEGTVHSIAVHLDQSLPVFQTPSGGQLFHELMSPESGLLGPKSRLLDLPLGLALKGEPFRGLFEGGNLLRFDLLLHDGLDLLLFGLKVTRVTRVEIGNHVEDILRCHCVGVMGFWVFSLSFEKKLDQFFSAQKKGVPVKRCHHGSSERPETEPLGGVHSDLGGFSLVVLSVPEPTPLFLG